jgi:hypothetical protein
MSVEFGGLQRNMPSKSHVIFLKEIKSLFSVGGFFSYKAGHPRKPTVRIFTFFSPSVHVLRVFKAQATRIREP